MNKETKESLKKMFLSSCKNKPLYIILIIICTILSIVTLTFSSNISNYVNDELEKYIGYRTLNVSLNYNVPDYGKNELSSIKHVDDVYEAQYNSLYTEETSFKNNNVDGAITLLYSTQKNLPVVIEGRTFETEERNVAICPKNFYPNSSADDYIINDKYMINGSDILGKTFTINYSNYELKEDTLKEQKHETKFKVVGLYDNTKVMNFNNSCYVSSYNIKEIIDMTSLYNKNNNNGVTIDEGFLVVIDKVDNVDSVSKQLSKLGYTSNIISKIDVNLVKTIQTICITILIVITAIIIFTTFYTKKKLVDKTMLTTFILVNIFSYIIGTILFLILYLITKYILLKSLIYTGINITISLNAILFSILIIVIVPTVILFYNIKKIMRKQNIN